MTRSPRSLVLLCCAATACGDTAATSAGSTTSASSASSATTATTDASATDPTGTAPTTGASGTGTGTATGTTGTTEVAPTTTAVTATTGTTGTTGSTGGTTTDTTTGTTTDTTTSTSSDTSTGSGTTGGCPDIGGDIEFSYIWIANSPEGTVSKIDTQTLQEVGRYRVRPQGGGEPSRTSVNLKGDVVIGSRIGGVTKIWARPADCKESNGVPGIQTSKGKNDVLAWGQEECVAWYTDYNFTSERAVAWTTGTLNPQTCEYDDPKVWIGATSDSQTLRVLRLHGDDGSMDGMVDIPGTAGYMSRSPYGAAVDANNEVWMVNAYCGGTLVHIHEDYMYETFNVPPEVCPYGIAVDSKGYIWIGGYQQYTGRYDPIAAKWDLVAAQGLGIQEDAKGKLWLGAYGQNGVYEIDGDSLAVLSYTAVPTTGQSKGISIDFYGYVWIVSDAGTTAVRMDPLTKAIQTYAGLNDPYSYSDMTGWGLQNAVIPQ
jgi:hypothetical protein